MENKKPWEILGISRATYFRTHKSLTFNETKLVNETGEVRLGLCETHPGNKGDITREQMKTLIDAGQRFIPNWYHAGLPCKEAAIQKALASVRNSPAVKSTGLKV